MLIRLITVISLFTFMLLMISGTAVETALFRSILVFLVLFTVIYLTIFFLNIIRDNSKSGALSDGGQANGRKND
ncbi:MAG: hypothetical protein WEC12_08345 [Balneolaceae bacterium]